MSGSLSLRVTTPMAIVLDETGIASLRAEDASGDFGILPGHADFLTAIDAGVLRWRRAGGDWRFCALRGGIFRVTGGARVEIACREAVPGDDLAELQARVAEAHAAQLDAARQTRSEGTKLHARAIRHLMRQLMGDQRGYALLAELDGGEG